MSYMKNKLKSQDTYKSIFLLLHRKLWFQLKFLIQDLVILSSYISFIFLKENKNLCVFNGKRLMFFYQRFKKFLRKFMQVQKLNIFLLYISKNELVYTEDRIIFIENELHAFKKFQRSQFSFVLTLNLLSKYYIFLKNSNNKNNWIKQCNVVQKKIIEHNGKRKFSKNLSRFTRTFSIRILDEYWKEEVKKKLSLNLVPKNLSERKKLVQKTDNLLSKKRGREKNYSRKKTQSNINLIYTDFHPKLAEMHFNTNSRRNFDKQQYLFGINLFRIRRKIKNRSFFLEKPEFNPYFLIWFMHWQENRQFSSLFKLQTVVKSKNRIRWSILGKIMQIFFREIHFFSLNYKKNNVSLNFLNQTRQLIDIELFSEEINCLIISPGKYLDILVKKIMTPFLIFDKKFFCGWS